MNFRLGIVFAVLVCVTARGHGGIAITEGLAPWQVLQRAPDDTATITLKGTADQEGEIWAKVSTSQDDEPVMRTHRIGRTSGTEWEATLGPIPTGGEYTVTLELRSAAGNSETTIEHVLVGDLWLLIGQSNMAGVGELDSQLIEEPSPQVHLFTLKREWEPAVEPLHDIFESQDPNRWEFLTHHERGTIDPPYASTMGGVGPGLFFGKLLAEETGVPIGLIAAAHGGSRIEQWEPTGREHDTTLYGFTARSAAEAGGRIAGILWYQGETDALIPGEASKYRGQMVHFLSSLREDLGNSRLPIVYAQIGRYTVRLDDGHAGWWRIQEAQRLSLNDLSNTAIVATIDLPLNDTIHLSTHAQKILGTRMARQALRLVHGRDGHSPAPHFNNLTTIDGDRPTLRVTFQKETTPLTAGDAIPGFRIVNREGQDQLLVFNAATDPACGCCVRIYIRERLKPEGELYLTYAMDSNPSVSLGNVDGQAALAFGPISLGELDDNQDCPHRMLD